MAVLKPCPFCGGTAKMKVVEGSVINVYKVYCDNISCQTLTQTKYQPTEEMAAKVWNERVNDG